jgi:hypothetical protein
VVPGLWEVAILAKVQFPWRALMLAEFALITAAARSPSRGAWAALPFLPLITLSILFLRPQGTQPGEWTPESLHAERPEVLEYLPNGASRERGTYSQWALDLARRHPTPILRAGRTIVPAFFFPAWQVRCAGQRVPTAPDPETKLLSYTGQGCAVTRGWLPAEWIGAAISALALALIAAAAFTGRTRAAGIAVALRRVEGEARLARI